MKTLIFILLGFISFTCFAQSDTIVDNGGGTWKIVKNDKYQDGRLIWLRMDNEKSIRGRTKCDRYNHCVFTPPYTMEQTFFDCKGNYYPKILIRYYENGQVQSQENRDTGRPNPVIPGSLSEAFESMACKK